MVGGKGVDCTVFKHSCCRWLRTYLHVFGPHSRPLIQQDDLVVLRFDINLKDKAAFHLGGLGVPDVGQLALKSAKPQPWKVVKPGSAPGAPRPVYHVRDLLTEFHSH
jgi:hypothetical protein